MIRDQRSIIIDFVDHRSARSIAPLQRPLMARTFKLSANLYRRDSTELSPSVTERPTRPIRKLSRERISFARLPTFQSLKSGCCRPRSAARSVRETRVRAILRIRDLKSSGIIRSNLRGRGFQRTLIFIGKKTPRQRSIRWTLLRSKRSCRAMIKSASQCRDPIKPHMRGTRGPFVAVPINIKHRFDAHGYRITAVSIIGRRCHRLSLRARDVHGASLLTS